MGRKRTKAKTLSAHEAGRLAPRTQKHPVRYDAEEPDQAWVSLTVREEEVLSLIASNKTNRDISASAGITVATVEKHLENIYPKLGVNSRTEAAVWFLTRQLEGLERENAELKRQLAPVLSSSPYGSRRIYENSRLRKIGARDEWKQCRLPEIR